MNILVILGTSAIISPLPFLNNSYTDLMVAIFAPILLILLSFIWTKNSIWRKEGVLLILSYIGYIIYLILKEIA
jgi:cation:H+ antiporter